jgi:hypothetical protein
VTPTDALFRAAARLETDARLGRAPSDVALQAGTAASQQPFPLDARDRARRHLAIAGWLRAWAVHEPEERAAALTDRADAQDVMAALTLAGGARLAA